MSKEYKCSTLVGGTLFWQKQSEIVKINPVKDAVDPNFLLNHALYMPDGETSVKSNMTLGQAIEAIAFAHIKAKLPHLTDNCQAARIKITDGKFVVKFANGMENLIF